MEQITDQKKSQIKDNDDWLDDFLSDNDATPLLKDPHSRGSVGNASTNIIHIDNIANIKNKAIQLYQKGKYEDASKTIEDAIRILPADLELNFFHAQCLYYLKKWEQSVMILKSLIKLDEKHTNIHVPRFYMFILLKQEKFREAKKNLETLLQKYNRDMQLLGMLGFIEERLSKLEEAQTIYREILGKAENNANACNSLAYVLYRMKGDMEEAIQLAERALSLEPSNPSFLDTYAMVQFWAGNNDVAKEYLDKAIKISPDNGTILSHMGEILQG